MCKVTLTQVSAGLILTALLLGSISCAASARNEEFFGKTDPPPGNVLRYITGDEPESLDPQLSSGQPESRIFMALYEGLVEYDGKKSRITEKTFDGRLCWSRVEQGYVKKVKRIEML